MPHVRGVAKGGWGLERQEVRSGSGRAQPDAIADSCSHAVADAIAHSEPDAIALSEPDAGADA